MADKRRAPGPLAGREDESNSALPAALIDLVAKEEHIALLTKPGAFQRFGRRDDLLDGGVAALFGLVGAEAELLGLCFQAGKFISAEAVEWLARHCLWPLLFIPHMDGSHCL
jgi:hypothetical protein